MPSLAEAFLIPQRCHETMAKAEETGSCHESLLHEPIYVFNKKVAVRTTQAFLGYGT
jgi:hypothetical protein